MNTSNAFPTPEDLTLPEIMARFSNEEKAIEYMESLLWLDGPVCPHCGNADSAKIWKLTANKEKKIRVGLRQCAECKKSFRVTVGTIFEDSHITLDKWLIAWYLLSGAKKGISAKQMQRHLGLGSYKSAWFLCHRIRHALADVVPDGKPLNHNHSSSFDRRSLPTTRSSHAWSGAEQFDERPNYSFASRCIQTARSARSAGVTPLIRDASPRVSGRMLASLCLASGRMP